MKSRQSKFCQLIHLKRIQWYMLFFNSNSKRGHTKYLLNNMFVHTQFYFSRISFVYVFLRLVLILMVNIELKRRMSFANKENHTQLR